MPECHFADRIAALYFMISIKLMTDGIIRGSRAMAYL